jgi:hypothetical protein
MFIGVPASTAILTCSPMAPMVLKAAMGTTRILKTGSRSKTQSQKARD